MSNVEFDSDVHSYRRPFVGGSAPGYQDTSSGLTGILIKLHLANDTKTAQMVMIVIVLAALFVTWLIWARSGTHGAPSQAEIHDAIKLPPAPPRLY